jgi:hypothetical protein
MAMAQRRWALYPRAVSQGRWTTASRSGFQVTGGDDLLTPRRYQLTRVWIMTPMTRITARGGGHRRWEPLRWRSDPLCYCTMVNSQQSTWQLELRVDFLQILLDNSPKPLHQSCSATYQIQIDYRDYTYLSTGSRSNWLSNLGPSHCLSEI